ncbi:MAG TPA: response regulator, partial [Solirubrobacterales bacterium]|nr:response regulator [Solirubrobacterales bacterium]
MVDIAIADDSAVIRNLIEEIIRYETGYKLVASFDNGRDIVAWARDGGHADVFVIDMRLPGLSGTATISALRRHLPDARMLAFSASAQEESIKA